MGNRRRGRAYALQVLYALDAGSDDTADEAVEGYRHLFAIEAEGEVLTFAQSLVEQTRGDANRIDETVQSASRNWRLERMSRVDRNILRLAAGELLLSPDVPTKVIINEAVELAKRFGAAESPAFVNGILDRVAQQVRPETDPSAASGADP